MKFTQLRVCWSLHHVVQDNLMDPTNGEESLATLAESPSILWGTWFCQHLGSVLVPQIFKELLSGQALWRDAVLTWSLWVCPRLSVQSHCHRPGRHGDRQRVYPSILCLVRPGYTLAPAINWLLSQPVRNLSLWDLWKSAATHLCIHRCVLNMNYI